MPATLGVLAIGIALGTTRLLHRRALSVKLNSLPQLPALAGKSQMLRKAVSTADQAVRIAIRSGAKGTESGKRVGYLGKIYQANQYYKEAALCYRAAMELDRENPRWPYFLAWVQMERGENESVIELLDRTIQEAPSYAPAVLKLGDTYFKNGAMARARSLYERRLNLVPEDPYALMGLARISVDQLQWKAAEGLLKRAISSHPGFGDAYRLLAAVHDHFGRSSEALQAREQAGRCGRFQPAPDPWVDAIADLCYEPDLLLVHGSKAIARQDVKGALERFYHRALELAPRDAKVHLAIGKARLMLGETKTAQRFLEDAVKLNPHSDEAYFHLGLILRNEGKLSEAEKMFLRALKLGHNNPNINNNMGVALLEQGRFEEAAVYFRKALNIYPEHLEARYNLGMAFWAEGNIQAAITEYRLVLQAKPKWKRAANSLAWVLATDKQEKNRNGKEALRWALVACQGDGRANPGYLDTLAAAYAEVGDFAKAVKTAEECLRMAVSYGDAALAQEVERRLSLYRSGTAFRE